MEHDFKQLIQLELFNPQTTFKLNLVIYFSHIVDVIL